MKHIGILAHTAEGAGLCYLTACHEGGRRLGPYLHPDISLSIISMGESLPDWERSDFAAVRARLAVSAQRLKAANCDFFICPCNTAHLALEVPGPPLALPGIHIAEVAADEAERRNWRTVGLLGTKWMMEGPIYSAAFARRGLVVRTPDSIERQTIDRLIFDELCQGICTPEGLKTCVEVIRRLSEDGCEAVILGCTEIPLLVTNATSPLPTLDSTRLLGTAAVRVSLGEEPFPHWRGGPFALKTQSSADKRE